MVDPQEGNNLIVSELSSDPDMVELVEMFVDELPEKMEAFKSALEAGEIDTLRSLSHQLKGSGGGYGFPSITLAARQLENAAIAGQDLEKMAEEIKGLTELCERARAAPPGE